MTHHPETGNVVLLIRVYFSLIGVGIFIIPFDGYILHKIASAFDLRFCTAFNIECNTEKPYL